MNIPKRVQRGLKWLRTEGPLYGLQLSSALDQLEHLNMRNPRVCVIGLAGGGTGAYNRLASNHSMEWLWRHGFEASDHDDAAVTYPLLDAEWRRVLTEDVAP